MAKQIIEVDDVVGTTFALPGASGSLNQNLKVEKREFKAGDKFWLVIEGTVVDVAFKAVDRKDPTGAKTRAHTGVIDASLFATKEQVGELVEQQKAAMALFRDEESGQQTIEHDAELELQHKAGAHKRLRKGCPKCEEEKRLVAEEKAKAADEKKKDKADRAAAKALAKSRAIVGGNVTPISEAIRD